MSNSRGSNQQVYCPRSAAHCWALLSPALGDGARLGRCPGHPCGAGAESGVPRMSLHQRGEQGQEKMSTLLQVLFFLCPPHVPLEGSLAPFPWSRVVFCCLALFLITRVKQLSGKLMFIVALTISFSVSPVLKPQVWAALSLALCWICSKSYTPKILPPPCGLFSSY